MKYGGVKTKYRQIRADFSLKKDLLYQQLWELEPHSATNDIPLTWNKAINFSVYDDLGNKWIDMTSGIFVANAGHANPVIKAAICYSLITIRQLLGKNFWLNYWLFLHIISTKPSFLIPVQKL